MSDTVGIIGYGRIGSALERIAAAAHRRVLTWDAAPGLSVTAPSLEAAVISADLLFLCVPSWSARTVAARVARILPAGAAVVSFAKGIEAETGLCMDEVLDAALGNSATWGVAGGPMFAEELARGRSGFLVLGLPAQAGASARTAIPRVRELFEGSNVHVDITKDAHGVALGGVLKNVYATLLGVAHGVDIGSNAFGALMLAAQAELIEVGVALGGKRATLAGLAGVGDFVATVSSAESRNRHTGECIASGEMASAPGEGCVSLAPFIERLTREGVGMPPLLATLADIIVRGVRPQPALRGLIARLPIRPAQTTRSNG
ncbi:MAG: NAD(P)-dependent oxidoreductase [bacterium]|nr:NAD(P)-dependent oxidoreductase [bacterium]